MRYFNRTFDLPKYLYRLTDRYLLAVIYSLVDLHLIRQSLTKEAKYFDSDTGMKGRVEFLSTWLTSIQARASASISHISIMMGVTILLLLRGEPSTLLAVIMLLEIGLYIFLLLGCLLCVRSLTLNDGVVFEQLKSKYKVELIRRFATMQVVNSFLIIATIGFFIIIVASIIGL